MRSTKEEQKIRDFEDKLFRSFYNCQSEKNRDAIISYMKTQIPPLTVGWVRRLRIGEVVAAYNYHIKGWQVFLLRDELNLKEKEI